MLQEILDRRSIRRYSDKPVEEEKLLDLIESARLAPSGSNTQPWNFLIIRNRQTIGQIAHIIHDQGWISRAPVLLACVADINSRYKDGRFRPVDDYSTLPELKMIIRDSMLAMENVSLEAVHLGLGTCMACWYEQKDMRPLLHVPEDHYVVATIAVGYPAEAPSPRPRRPLESMVRHETWDGVPAPEEGPEGPAGKEKTGAR